MLIDLKDKKWWVQEAAGWLQLCYPWMRGFVETDMYYDPGYGQSITIMKDDYLWSVMDEEDDFRMASAIHEKFHADPDTLISKIEVWRRLKDKVESIFERVHQTDLLNSDKRQVADLYQEFFQAYEDVFIPALLCEAFVPYSEKYLIPEISKLSMAAGLGKGEKIAAVLTAPLEASNLTLERIDLLKIALMALDGKNIGPELVRHQKEYFWIKNNYKDDEPITVEEFRSYVEEEKHKGRDSVETELAKLEGNIQKLAQEKQSLLAKLKPDEKLTSGMKLIEILGDWQDKRKAIMQQASYYMTLLLRAISQQVGLTFEQVAYATPEEIASLLSGEMIPGSVFEQRRKFCVAAINKQGEYLLVGNQAQEAWDMVFAQGQAREKSISGVVACTGRVRGKVKIVRDPAKDAFEEGEILVTSMTRPEFVPYMKKALAIVTDEGGLTCHAAIVSRELNVPCIVGTKVATKVLKDGDYVEVNASHGSVTKL